MNIFRIFKHVAAAVPALSLLLVSASSWGQQGEQVLSDVAVFGQNAVGDGVVRPDLADEEDGDYTPWVAPAADRDFRDFEIAPTGEAVVLDGTVFRKFNSAGNEAEDADVDNPVDGFPFDCTALTFTVINERNGREKVESISDCLAFTILNNAEMRIAVEARGGGFKIISHDPQTDTTELQVDGAPPDISDMDSREFPDAVDSNLGVGYLMVGERSKVLFVPLDPPDSEQNFITLEKFGGARIDAVTSLGLNSVIVVLDTGEFRVLEIDTNGDVTERAPLNSESQIVALKSRADCGLGRKAPQKYSVRWDPSGVLFAGNRGCNSIALFNESLDEILSGTTELVTNPFILEDKDLNPDVENPALVTSDFFFVDGLDWTVGVPGDFSECTGTEGCEFGQQAGSAVMFGVQTVSGTNTSFLMLKFIYPDCRWATGVDPTTGLSVLLECPIVNCLERWPDWGVNTCATEDPAEQVLDITPILIEIDETGIFEELAFGDGPVQEMLIPANLRGERRVPTTGDGVVPIDCSGQPDPLNCVDNGYEIITYFAANETIFSKTFFVDYQLDLVREIVSFDPCLIPLPESTIGAITETNNIILYNSSDGFGTVNRGGIELDRGGVIGNSFCNGGATRARWSANTISLEFYEENVVGGDVVDSDIVDAPNPRLYVDQAVRMMAELRLLKETKICAAFDNPEVDDDTEDPEADDLGPLLTADCGPIEDELVLVNQKLVVCLESLFETRQGNSAENCNAFVTKIQNLRNVLASAAWPIPSNLLDLTVLKPNYEGEFLARIDALEFLVLSYAVNSAPAPGLAGSL